jgi:hypothetical protein
MLAKRNFESNYDWQQQLLQTRILYIFLYIFFYITHIITHVTYIW